MPGDGILVEPYSVMKSTVISAWVIVTCNPCQVIEALREEGVGIILTAVAVGCGAMTEGVAVVEQATSMSAPSMYCNTIFDVFFIERIMTKNIIALERKCRVSEI